MKQGKILVLFIGFFTALSLVCTTLSTDAKAENWDDYVNGIEGTSEMTDKSSKTFEVVEEYTKTNGITPQVRVLSKTTGFPLKRIYELYPSKNKNK